MAFLDQSGPVTAAQDHSPAIPQSPTQPAPESPTSPPIQSPQAQPTQNAPLQQGLGLDFGNVMRQIAPYVSGGAPLSILQQEATAEGDALKAQQKQKIAEAQANQESYKKYGDTANRALLSYDTEMAAEPLPAFVPTKETAADFSLLGGLISVIGFMAGKGKGMQSGLDALDSMTGMMNGWQQGRKDLYDRELKNFQANFERLNAVHEQYRQQLTNALEVAKVNLTQGLADAQLAAAKAGDDVVLAQAKAGNLKAVIAAMNSQQTAMLKAAEIAGKLYQTEASNLPLNPDTMDFWADWALNTGQLPPLGFGASGLRRELLSKVASRAKDKGTTADVAAANAVTRKANAAALSAITRTRVLIENYEQTATKSSYLVESLANKGIGPTGTPAIDAWIQAGRRATGDPNVTALNNAIQTLTSEYAKVMSGGYGAATTPEGAQSRAQTLINEAQNIKQLQRATGIMRQEMEFRRTSLLDEQKAVTEDLQKPGIIHEPQTKYSLGQVLDVGGKKYRVTGGDLNNDPDVEPVQ